MAALHSLITGGKVNLTSKEISDSFRKIKGPQRKVLESTPEIAERSNYLNSLPGAMERSKSLGNEEKEANSSIHDLEKQLTDHLKRISLTRNDIQSKVKELHKNLKENLKSIEKEKGGHEKVKIEHEKAIDNILKEIENKEQQRYGHGHKPNTNWKLILKGALLKAAGTTALGVPFVLPAGRMLEKILSNPELIQKYIKKEKV